MLLNLLILIAASFGAFQLIILLALWKKMGEHKYYLTPLLVGIIWILLEFLAARNVVNIEFDLFYGTQYGSWMLLGPSIWFYWQSLLGKPTVFKKYLKHLIPFFLLVIFLPLILPDLIPQRANDYGMLTILFYADLGFTFWQGFYAIIFVLQFIHLIIYLVLSARLVKQSKQQNLHLQQKQIRPWLQWSLFGIAAIILGSVIFFVGMLFLYKYVRAMDYFYALPFAGFTFFLTFKFNLFPLLMRKDLKSISNGVKYQKSNLDEALLKAYAQRLEKGMKEKKLFRKSDLTLASLAGEISINPHHLSQVLNSQFNQKFYEYINQYRIEEAQKLLQSNHKTTLQIALEVGFNNKATFHKYFKKYTGTTPTQFREKR